MSFAFFLNSDVGEVLSGIVGQVPREQRKALLFAFLFSLVSYGFYAFAPVLGREELFYIGRRGLTMNDSYAQAGRPFAWILSHKIFAGSFVPFFSICFSSLLLSCAGIILGSNILGLNKTIDLALVASLFATSPFFAETQAFQMWNIVFAISVILPLIACYLSLAKPWTYLPMSSLLLALTLAIYQSSISVFSVSVVIYLLANASGDRMEYITYKRYFTIALKSLSALVLSIILYAPLYYFMTRNLYGYTEYQNQKIENVNQFFLNISKMFNIEREYIFSLNSWVYRENFSYLFVIISLIFGMRIISNNEAYGKKIVRILIILFLLTILVPSFRIEGLVIANIAGEIRLWMAIAVFISGICGITLLSNRILLKNVALGCCALLLFSFVLFHNVQSFFLWTEREHDLSVANRVALRIENHKDFSPKEKYLLFVSGAKSTSATERGLYKVPLSHNAIITNSDSFPSMLAFVGLENVEYDWSNRTNIDFIHMMSDKSKDMPQWPAEGSIKFLPDNRILIRF